MTTLFGERDENGLGKTLVPIIARVAWALIGAVALFIYQSKTADMKQEMTSDVFAKQLADNTTQVREIRDEQARLHSQLRPSVELVSQDQFKEFTANVIHRLDALDAKTDRLLERRSNH